MTDCTIHRAQDIASIQQDQGQQLYQRDVVPAVTQMNKYWMPVNKAEYRIDRLDLPNVWGVFVCHYFLFICKKQLNSQ